MGQRISENEKAAEALSRANGYERGHTSWLLRIGFTAPQVALKMPAGFWFQPYDPGRDDRDIYAVIDESFQESRGLSSESKRFENWVASSLHSAQPGLVILVTDATGIVAAAIGYDYGSEVEGWIEEVAASRAHRGKGLGRGLIEECYRRFYALGRRQCGVSTDSRTGALSFYEHMGMSVQRTCTRWITHGL